MRNKIYKDQCYSKQRNWDDTERLKSLNINISYEVALRHLEAMDQA